MADSKPFSRNGNLLAPPPRPKGKKIIGVKTEPNESQEAARKLEDSGFKVKDGQLTPTQDYGEMVALASEQRNSLSRDSKPGSVSTLSNPMNSMYAANPGFFNRGGRGGAVVSPEAARAQNIAKAKEAGTFDSIRDQYNAKGGAQMNEFGTIGAAAPALAPAPAPAPAAPATAESVAAQRASIQGAAAPAAPAASAAPDPNKPQSSEWLTENRPVQFDSSGLPKLPWAGDTAESGLRTANRQALEQGAAGIRLQREAMGQMPTVKATNAAGASINPSGVPLPGESRTIEGKYGGGSATFSAPGTPRKEGMINGMPASEALQGLANKTGIAREGDLYQPQVGAAPIKSFREALAELSRPAPKTMTTASAAPSAPSASTPAAAPILNRGNATPLANPTSLGAGGNLAPPKNIFSPPNIPTQAAASSPTAAPPRIAPDFRALKELDGGSPAAAPPPASTPSPVSGMTINNPTSLKSGTPTPLAPPTSINSGNKMVPTKDDITKQRASLASTKR